jgi:DNA-binding transcriptional MerR regulator
MRIAELSRRTGVPVPTIKYYLREGLLHAGAATAANQAFYGDDHVRRLRLIRALIDVGGVSVSAASDVIATLDADDLSPHDLLGTAHNAVMPTRRPDRDTEGWQAARAGAEALVAGRGWQVSPGAPALDLLTDVMSALANLGATDMLDHLDGYADAATTLANLEVDILVARPDRASMVELVVIGTVLGEALFNALRLLAHEHASAVHFSPAVSAESAR